LSEFIDNLLFIFQRLNWLSVVDLFLVTMIFFALLHFLRNTQAMVLLRGVFFLFVIISLVIAILDLPAFSWLVRTSVPVLLLAIPVIFASEIRRALERLGRAGSMFTSGRGADKTLDVISAISHSAARLSARRHGALIVLQRLDDLDEYIQTGITLDAQVSSELLLQIFYPNTPLHDGAAIISKDHIRAAGCVMPLSASGVLADTPDRKIGLRHRAALGSSEVSDAVVIVVSEETGAVSVSYGGRMIHRLDAERLEGVLRAFYKPLDTKKGLDEFISRWLPFLSPGRDELMEM
jgi:diadenylate cyclase